jgi:hypothetical protein
MNGCRAEICTAVLVQKSKVICALFSSLTSRLGLAPSSQDHAKTQTKYKNSRQRAERLEARRKPNLIGLFVTIRKSVSTFGVRNIASQLERDLMDRFYRKYLRGFCRRRAYP